MSSNVRRVGLGAVALFVGCGLRAAERPQVGAAPQDEAWPAVVRAFRDGCAEERIVGASLAFVRGADLVGLECYGLADRATGRDVDRDTIYHWASITKTFTGIAVMQLRDRGRLGLDDPVVQHVPELRDVHDRFGSRDAITLRHLLQHAGGFRAATWPFGGDEPWHPYEPRHWSQIVAMLPYTDIAFEPGSRHAYSNLGIVFVGRAIEAVAHEEFEVYADKNLLRPLGMTHAYFDTTPYHLQRHRAHGYGRRGDELVDLGADFDTGITVSNGGLNAPITDLARYVTFLLGAATADAAGVLARPSLEEMWEPTLPTRENGGEHIGIAFFVQDRPNGRFVTHTGSQHGFQAFFWIHPSTGTGAVGVFNTDDARPLMERIRALCMDRLAR